MNKSWVIVAVENRQPFFPLNFWNQNGYWKWYSWIILWSVWVVSALNKITARHDIIVLWVTTCFPNFKKFVFLCCAFLFTCVRNNYFIFRINVLMRCKLIVWKSLPINGYKYSKYPWTYFIDLHGTKQLVESYIIVLHSEYLSLTSHSFRRKLNISN